MLTLTKLYIIPSLRNQRKTLNSTDRNSNKLKCTCLNLKLRELKIKTTEKKRQRAGQYHSNFVFCLDKHVSKDEVTSQRLYSATLQ